MNHFIAFIALVGFILSLVVHISALFGIDFSDHLPFILVLTIGVFVVYAPFVISSQIHLGERPKFSKIRDSFPNWVIVIGIALFIYMFINFVLVMVATEGGSPDIWNDKYVLHSHGTLIRELTQAEYSFFKANEIRGLSGHLLFFYFIPFAYFKFRKKSNLPLNSDAPKNNMLVS